jgi:tRNA/rRNA methyltransferase
MFWAYMLRCSDGTYYVGHTDALEQRVAQHQHGEIAGYTQKRRPVELAWSQDFSSRIEALTAEAQLKGWGRAKKEALIAGDWDLISTLARKSFDTRLRQAQPLLRTNGVGEIERNLVRSPILVLVRPQLGENIGKAARAMLNFGLTELRLVAPRDGWPNPSAGPAASGADSVLADAQVYETVAEATADCAHVYATTVRKRGVVKPVLTPEAAATEMLAVLGRSAILFGPERTGLETDDVAIARTIITVPINPKFGSLNLAQAVMVVAYEWSKSQNLAQPPKVDDEPPAPQAELDGLVDQLDAMLDYAGFYFPPDKVPTVQRNIRSILTKPGWNAQEVRTLRGVLTAIEKPRPKT